MKQALKRVDAQKHSAPIIDPPSIAKAAGLRYVTDSRPGIKRLRSGKKWRYVEPDGSQIHDPEILKRIKSLGIPPAYRDVWICPNPSGHLQATARDARGRKQYRYHHRWREVRDSSKYDKVFEFGRALPKIRERTDADLALRGMPREKLLATLVRLLETTLIRVGNEEYVKQNQSYGLTTMQNEHVEVHGSEVEFHFRGKSGKTHHINLKDRRLAKIVRKCQELPGQTLFEYMDENGNVHSIDSSDVNDYLREITGEEFTAKDFRTWAGTVLAATFLSDCNGFESEKDAKKNIKRVIQEVSERLGNTPAICRKCYVHPEVINAYLRGTLCAELSKFII
jgi:DNA topoisomerase-1